MVASLLPRSATLRLAAALLLFASAFAPSSASAQASAPAEAPERLAEATLAASEAEPEVSRDALPLYYAPSREVVLYADVMLTRVLRRLGFREQLYRRGVERGRYIVETERGERGYVLPGQVSDLWILVSKADKEVRVYHGESLVESFPADFGYNAFADKERQGSQLLRDHWRTPEGGYTVVRRNANSQYYKALVLNYPNAEDAERGLREGLISRSQYRQIVRAAERHAEPPMFTSLGGLIEIHGDGTGGRSNWTRGCVALTNPHMDRLWEMIPVGTPVVIE